MARMKMFLYFVTALGFALLAAVDQECPSQYPIAYYKGHFCCGKRKEKNCMWEGCKGDKINITTSTCCKNDNYTRCQNPPCKDGCVCSETGSLTIACDDKRQCPCKEGYNGKLCQCPDGHYELPDGKCKGCDCNPKGVDKNTCDSQGKCTCIKDYVNDKCDGAKDHVTNIGNLRESWAEVEIKCDGPCDAKSIIVRWTNSAGYVDIFTRTAASSWDGSDRYGRYCDGRCLCTGENLHNRYENCDGLPRESGSDTLYVMVLGINSPASNVDAHVQIGNFKKATINRRGQYTYEF